MKRRIVIPFLLVAAAVAIIGLQLYQNLSSQHGGGGTPAPGSGGSSIQADVPMVAVTVLPPEKKIAPPKAEKALKVEQRPAKLVKQKNQDDAGSRARRVNQDGEGSGEPNLYARYELAMPDYLHFMRSRGAKILVYDLAKNQPVCEVDESGNLYKPSGNDGFSPASRRITDDYPGGDKLVRKVEQQFGKGSFEILLLLPESMVHRLRSQVRQVVQAQGLSYKDIATVFLAYRGSRSVLSVYVDKVATDQGTKKIGATFQL